jgi:phosphoglycolate phosphatase-like HAD superfamily hydrolase
MVGESDVDVQTARNAGMFAVNVTYGFGQHDRTANPADLYIDSLLELARLAPNAVRSRV